METIPFSYACAVSNYEKKAELSKSFWYPKRKLGVTIHFSEIVKLQYGNAIRFVFNIAAFEYLLLRTSKCPKPFVTGDDLSNQ